MKKSSVFEKELEKVGNLENRSATVAFLETVVPEYFWYVPASSTGKYHPDFAQGDGGLIRHTKAAVCVAEELLKLDDFVFASPDIVYAAIIIHDCFKYGREKNRYTRKDHGEICATEWIRFIEEENIQVDPDFAKGVFQCVLWHMGQWSDRDTFERYHCPDEIFRDELKVVELSDYISSRKFMCLEKYDISEE